jgi:hypothetical protein
MDHHGWMLENNRRTASITSDRGDIVQAVSGALMVSSTLSTARQSFHFTAPTTAPQILPPSAADMLIVVSFTTVLPPIRVIIIANLRY